MRFRYMEVSLVTIQIKERQGTTPGSLTGPLAEAPSPYGMTHLCSPSSRGVVAATIGRMSFSRPCGLPVYVLHPAWPAPTDELGRVQGRHSHELGPRQSSAVAHGPRLQSMDGHRAAQGLPYLLSLPAPMPYIKNAGGHPPALGSHLSRGAESFITYRGNELRANMKGHDTPQSQLAVKRFQAGILILSFMQEGENDHAVVRDEIVDAIGTHSPFVDCPSEQPAGSEVSYIKGGVIFKRVEYAGKGFSQVCRRLWSTEDIRYIGNGIVQATTNSRGNGNLICHTSPESPQGPAGHRATRPAWLRHTLVSADESLRPTAAVHSTLQSLPHSSSQNPAGLQSRQETVPGPGHMHLPAALAPNVPKLEVPWFSPFTSLVSVYAPCGQSPIVVDSLYGRSAA